MATNSSRIPESEWERRRPEITRLYYEEDWTREAVDQFMRDTHNFVASKWQYEKHFQAWNLRKNHSRGTWTKVGSLIRQGRLPGTIEYHGRPIAVKKVQRATARYRQTEAGQEMHEPLSPGFVSATTPTMIDNPMPSAQFSTDDLTPSLQGSRSVQLLDGNVNVMDDDLRKG
ncbi:hypothetical protein Micbo1qcDRAFT_220084 [Microdochium bolleyi]|uniref:Clr5 domain-containing protein n=1 Tax=Microdochium bolleyi TaxID=196109 RepID=A0A136IMC7_9PEZI|nr:hypothetical protein Micbo1qcDRAFT_220084 [Microdochium bolleyi]